MPHPLLSRLAAAGSLCALLGAAAPASAAIVVGTFDPAFGPTIPNLGFRGTVTVSVPDACFASTGLVANSDPCSALNGGMSLLSATVSFYNLTTPGNPTFASFNAVFPPGEPVSVVIGFDGLTLQNELLGINTSLSLPAGVSLSDFGPDLLPGGGNDVAFVGTMAVEFEAVDPNLPVIGAPYTARLSACDLSNLDECEFSNRATTVFDSRGRSVVPAPGSLPLVLAAAGVLGLVTRRRQRQSR